MLNFVIFVVHYEVTKISTHECFSVIRAYVHARLHVRTREIVIRDMALFRYLRPLDSSPLGSLAGTVPRAVLDEVKKEIKKVESTKRGSYLSFTPEEKAQVAKYGSTNRVRAAVKRFSNVFGKDLKESTVRDWVNDKQEAGEAFSPGR